MDGRAIPGSGKYMAVAGGHHTQTRGSLIVIDPSVPDDNAMSQIRRKPPVLQYQTLVGRSRPEGGARPEKVPHERLPRTARVGVVNVMNSRYPFPAGTVIKTLRIWQVLPKVSPIVNSPRIGLGDRKGGRQCLGTVPVEADGSAFFEVPVNIPIFSHAVDEKGGPFRVCVA